MYPTLKNQVINILRKHRGRHLHHTQIYELVLEVNPNQVINPVSIDRLLRELVRKDRTGSFKSDKHGSFWYVLEDDKTARLERFFK